MSRVHVLDNSGGNNFNAVTHVAVPTGNNSVGVPWKTCWLASLGAVPPSSMLLTTTLQGGNATNDPGKITSGEADSIRAGDLMEFQFQFTDEPQSTQAARDANIDAVALSVVTNRLNEFKDRFKFYGYTRT